MNEISANIQEIVGQFLADKKLLQKQDYLVFVGLSGGSDSVALLHILKSLSERYGDTMEIVATHCNFHLRGEESDRDMNFCKDLCKRMGLRLLIRQFDTFKYMEDHRLSLEMACRELRYKWWEELLESKEWEHKRFKRYIAVGHHQDDSIETILMNLMRGTGIKGLTGIVHYNRQTHVIRPLLCLNRQNIIDYCAAEGLDFVTDSTNRENDTQRNSIRNRLLPLMDEINPNTRRGIIKTMYNLQDIEKIATKEIEEQLGEHVVKEYRDKLLIKHLMTRDMDVNREDFPVLIREFLLSCGVVLHTNTLAEVIEAARLGIRKIIQGDSYWVCCSEDDLIANKKAYNFDNEEFIINGERIETESTVASDINVFVTTRDKIETLKVEPTMTLIDPRKVKLPLIIRHWREGDRIQPFGRQQTKLVSDLMTDAHFSWWKKATNWLVTDSNNNVLWVYGLRSSDIAKIDERTKNVIAIIGPE